VKTKVNGTAKRKLEKAKKSRRLGKKQNEIPRRNRRRGTTSKKTGVRSDRATDQKTGENQDETGDSNERVKRRDNARKPKLCTKCATAGGRLKKKELQYAREQDKAKAPPPLWEGVDRKHSG